MRPLPRTGPAGARRRVPLALLVLLVILAMPQMSSAQDTTEATDAATTDEDGEWEGFAEPLPVDYEAEYIDEDKYTTVTVEEMDPSREGFFKSGRQEDSDDGSDQEEGEVEKMETSLKDAKDAANQSAQHDTQNEALQRRLQILEEEAEEADRNLRETNEKYDLIDSLSPSPLRLG